MMLYPMQDQAGAPEKTNTELKKRVADLETALKPFAEAYETLLDNKPSPEVFLNTVEGPSHHAECTECGEVGMDVVHQYGKRSATVQWSDLYRAANLLREIPHD